MNNPFPFDQNAEFNFKHLKREWKLPWSVEAIEVKKEVALHHFIDEKSCFTYVGL